MRFRSLRLDRGVKEIGPPVLLEDGRIAQFIDGAMGGAADRRDERCIGALPTVLRPEDFDRPAFLPTAPVAP